MKPSFNRILIITAAGCIVISFLIWTKLSHQCTTHDDDATTQSHRRLRLSSVFGDPKTVKLRSKPQNRFKAVPSEKKKVEASTTYALKQSLVPTLEDVQASSYRMLYMSVLSNWVVRLHGSGEPLLHTFQPTISGNGPFFAIWTNGYEEVAASAWRVVEDTSEYLDAFSYVAPPIDEISGMAIVDVQGDQAAFHSWMPHSYGHTIDHHLAWVAFLKYTVSASTGFLFLDVGPLKDILRVLDPPLFERITWLKPKEVARVNDGNLIVAFHYAASPPSDLHPLGMDGDDNIIVEYRPDAAPPADLHPRYGANGYLQIWLGTIRPNSPSPPVVIYYARVDPSQAKHGRIMDSNHSKDIISLIEGSMERHNRAERLIEFDGTTDDNGQKRSMTILEQFDLFRSATTLIGPHGTGMANMIWMDLESRDRPKVVEFTVGPRNVGKFDDIIDPFAKTYTSKYWGLPFDYNHMLFAPNSTNSRAFVDLNVLDGVLDRLWANDKTSSGHRRLQLSGFNLHRNLRMKTLWVRFGAKETLTDPRTITSKERVGSACTVESIPQLVTALCTDAEQYGLRPWSPVDSAGISSLHFPGLDSDLIARAFRKKRILLYGDSTIRNLNLWLYLLLSDEFLADTPQKAKLLSSLSKMNLSYANQMVLDATGGKCYKTPSAQVQMICEGWINTTHPDPNLAPHTDLIDGTSIHFALAHPCVTRRDLLGAMLEVVREFKPYVIVANIGLWLFHFQQHGLSKSGCAAETWINYEQWLENMVLAAEEVGVETIVFKTTNFICTDSYGGTYDIANKLYMHNDSGALQDCFSDLRVTTKETTSDADILNYCKNAQLNDNGSEYLNHRLFMFVKRRQRTTKAGLNLLVLNDHDMQSCSSTVENDGRHHHWLNLARIRILANMLTCQPFTSDGYNGIQNM